MSFMAFRSAAHCSNKGSPSYMGLHALRVQTEVVGPEVKPGYVKPIRSLHLGTKIHILTVSQCEAVSR